ncbi:MAG: hypothetical protein JWN35_1685 [Frankiales bacterium]|nr:hypothetical protein [Frankiales bacterium]
MTRNLADVTDSPLDDKSSSGKGRPTPKRRDATPRRGGPVTPPPATRREAAKRMRAEGAVRRRQVKAGTKAGDQRYLMARDAGPVRQLVRDLVDSRRHVGVLLLPAAVLPVAAQLTHSQRLLAMATTLWLATLVTAIFDFVLTGFVVRRRIRSDFPDEGKLGGHIAYGTVRTAQFRRFRLPPPRVRVGDSV